ncbi:MAG: hypothetical protein ACYTFI_22300 [Planctomycetota bacterium]
MSSSIRAFSRASSAGRISCGVGPARRRSRYILAFSYRAIASSMDNRLSSSSERVAKPFLNSAFVSSCELLANLSAASAASRSFSATERSSGLAPARSVWSLTSARRSAASFFAMSVSICALFISRLRWASVRRFSARTRLSLNCLT